LDFDHIIIGAGSAGCAVAKRLSESGYCQVPVLEAEEGGNSPQRHVPAGYYKITSNHKSDWRYKTEHFFGIANRASSWARGRFLDGNSVINGVHGLRVADTSIMPSIISGNTNAPAIMVGKRANALVLEDPR
jgi:choline dehydrogenase-like flavoprotein